MHLQSVFRLYHTLKYLKPIQIGGRLVNWLPRLMEESSDCPVLRGGNKAFCFPGKTGFTGDYVTFNFLNKSENLETEGWDNPRHSKLWRYNLHYFDCLRQPVNDPGEKNLQQNLIAKWIAENPFGQGTGWEPYPTSHRIINWAKWHWTQGRLDNRVALSLWNQTRWLAANLENHLLGNHLFLNAKALLFASALFDIPRDSKIFKKGLRIFTKQLDEQFLDDGGHFELSPMYHALAIEDLLDVLNVASCLPQGLPKKSIREKIARGLHWLRAMTHNNGEVAHFNDSANGIALPYDQLCAYARQLGMEFDASNQSNLTWLKESGYVVANQGDWKLIADIGEVGPDYLPGHAHADTLSFELSMGMQRVIVNSGTSVYGVSEERLRQRGTAAHSTVEFNGENSSEVWSGFRVARRARPLGVVVREEPDGIYCQAGHDGYRWLKGKPGHWRRWRFDKNALVVEDELRGNFKIAVFRIFFHPEITVEQKSDSFIISNSNRKLGRIVFEAESGCPTNKILETTFHDRFGVERPNFCLEVYSKIPQKMKMKMEFL